MRKVLNKKFFQRPSQNLCDDSHEPQMTEDPVKEIESLKNQIGNLKASVESLKLDTEDKEMKLAKLARDKEKLSMNLSKIRRSNVSLTQQLEDERHFYYKEKEIYCHEMNEYKRLKKTLSNSNLSSKIDCNEETEKLKKTLEQTLQTNYNLSIKFLRMKETKNYLCNSLHKAEDQYRRVVNDLKSKIEHLTTELKEILNQKFEAPLSPSNKKYLQLVNQNSSLIYENLCLQMQVDHLNVKIKRNKLQRTKSENSSRIQYTGKNRRNKRAIRKTPAPSEEPEVIKIFERVETPGLPTVTILNEKEITLRSPRSERKLQLPVVNDSKLQVFQVSELQSTSSVPDSTIIRQRSRSAPKIVQSVSFKDSAPPEKGDKCSE